MSRSITPSLANGHVLDVDKLVESRLLIQANSGGGKSWAIRRLAEQTYTRIPQIIIDVEGEFHTLREKYDYVLASQKGGDCPADLKSASLLARRLLELNVSAIVDIYELGVQRTRFVKLFLEALVNAPRELWHPLLVVVDEAHMFAPEGAPSESAAAVIDLMTRGRKRGFCGVLATQRISKLHKDAAAEANNKLIGRSALDIDMKRAAAELGFTSRDEMQSLRKLPAGTFYAFGPAISDTVTQLQIGTVATTHPKAGSRALAPTPPRERVKKILAQLADLPHEADEEAKTVGELRLKVKQLERDLRIAKDVAPAPKTVEKVVEKHVLKNDQLKRVETIVDKVQALSDRLRTLTDGLTDDAANLRIGLTTASLAQRSPPAAATNHSGSKPAANGMSKPKPIAKPKIEASYNGEKLPVGEAAILRAAIQFSDGLFKKQLTVLTGYKRSTRDAYIQRLREKGLLIEQDDRVFATDAGIAAMPDAEPLPVGEALRDFWFARLPSGEKAVLAVLTENYPNSIDKTTIDEATGFKRSTRDAYLSRLAAKELVIDAGRAQVQANATLFEGD